MFTLKIFYFFKDFSVIELMIDFNILCVLSSTAIFYRHLVQDFYLDKSLYELTV